MPVLKKISLTVSGMTCASCVINVEGILNDLSGVKKAVEILAAGKTSVEYYPSQMTLAGMIKAVDEIG